MTAPTATVSDVDPAAPTAPESRVSRGSRDFGDGITGRGDGAFARVSASVPSAGDVVVGCSSVSPGACCRSGMTSRFLSAQPYNRRRAHGP